VNWVEVAVTFQPALEPVASWTSTPSVDVVVWLEPFSVSLNEIVEGTTMLSVPPVIVAVAVVVAEATPDTTGATTAIAAPNDDAATNLSNRDFLVTPGIVSHLRPTGRIWFDAAGSVRDNGGPTLLKSRN
jgi:hypothetical protein